MLTTIAQWLHNHMLECTSKKYLHIECPGCGLQRSFIALLQGNFMQSLQLHPATIPLMATIIITALHLIFKFNNGAAYIKTLFIITAILTAIFYIYKTLTLKIIV
jgi:Protein of unknown function (DUF2752)